MSDDKDQKFLRHVAEEEHQVEGGGTLGNRIAVSLELETMSYGYVDISREFKMPIREKENEPRWQVDPDAGLTMTVDQARELYAALGECLAAADRFKENLPP